MESYVHSASDVVTDPELALKYLEEGNKRFVSGKMMHRKSSEEEWSSMQEGQYPFAAILACSDSRVSPSVIFDQKNGDLFTVRNAGNTADTVSLGSLEYAVEYLNVPLVVVCGHSDCGAVKAAFERMEGAPENLSKSLQCVENSLDEPDDVIVNRTEAEKIHLSRMVRLVKENPSVVKMGTKVVEAYYDIKTGKVIWG